MGRHSSPGSEAEEDWSATAEWSAAATSAFDEGSASGGLMATPDEPTRPAPREEQPQAEPGDEPTRTWSHGGQQAGWRKQKNSVALQPRDLRLTDWIVFLVGPLALAASFFDYYVHESAQEFGDARRISGAWTGWPAIWGAASVTLAAAGSLLAFVLIVGLNQGRSSARRAFVVAVFVLSVAAAVVAYVKEPQYSFGELDLSFNRPVQHTPGWGYWGCAVLILAGLLSAVLRLRELRVAGADADSVSGAQAATTGYVGSRRA